MRSYGQAIIEQISIFICICDVMSLNLCVSISSWMFLTIQILLNLA